MVVWVWGGALVWCVGEIGGVWGCVGGGFMGIGDVVVYVRCGCDVGDVVVYVRRGCVAVRWCIGVCGVWVR